ncbi:MAG TPA: 5-(carboxyamino)imidazole ribonucleotide synthase [Streptosporangiaceae bacterium]|nr:5-(carboxyamino)imidazole ribonucleotide synthase [Streptosporangiaceae bacterium]
MPVVGMVGAGQLARMTAQAAIGLGVEFRVLAGSATESAAQVCARTTIGDYTSAGDLLGFGIGCDVVTFDHEHVPGAQLAVLGEVTAVRPAREALVFAQDKLAMRNRLSSLPALAAHGVRCPRYRPVETVADVLTFVADEHAISGRPKWPVVLKAVSGGYDGRGVWVCDGPEAVAEVLSHGIGLLAEEHIAFDRELAVLVARSPKGQGACYPVVQTVQRDGICEEVFAPAPGLDPDVAVLAEWLGLTIAKELGVTGLLAVELFEWDGRLIINELAMRPHNSGHWTIDGAVTSQFEQHLRAVLDLPLGATTPTAPACVMVNLLGGHDPDLYSRFVHVMAADPGVRVHLYGKQVRPGRKIGHVTVAGQDTERLLDRARRAANYLILGTEEPEVSEVSGPGAGSGPGPGPGSGPGPGPGPGPGSGTEELHEVRR